MTASANCVYLGVPHQLGPARGWAEQQQLQQQQKQE